MSARASEAVRRPNSLVVKTVIWCAKAVIVLLMIWLVSIVIEWIGMWTFWKEEGVGHSQRVLRNERTYINIFVKQKMPNLVSQKRRKELFSIFGKGYDLVFERTGLKLRVDQLARGSLSQSYSSAGLSNFHAGLRDHVEAAGNVTKIFGIRLSILFLSLPLFLVVGAVAISNGLTGRYKRILGVGREYGTRYHYLKPEVRAALYLPWVLYLGIPVSLHPNYVILPFVVYFSVMMYLVTNAFKKHI